MKQKEQTSFEEHSARALLNGITITYGPSGVYYACWCGYRASLTYRGTRCCIRNSSTKKQMCFIKKKEIANILWSTIIVVLNDNIFLPYKRADLHAAYYKISRIEMKSLKKDRLEWRISIYHFVVHYKL